MIHQAPAQSLTDGNYAMNGMENGPLSFLESKKLLVGQTHKRGISCADV
jgi:hypothetical protein